MSSEWCLEWKNLEYTVPGRKTNGWSGPWCKGSSQQDIRILKSVTGCLFTGELVAIIGPSGSGKTTFLAAISQRIRGNLSGSILINGKEISRGQMPRISCFLPQFDIQVKALTAFEHLYFMSHFKMDKRTKYSDKINKVNALLFKVGLSENSTTRIEHLSGGERKRLSLAEELLTEPPFVFCDEPTTGLDSYNACSVVKTLRNLTKPRNTRFRSAVEAFGSADDENMEMRVMPTTTTTTGESRLIIENSLVDNGRRKGVMCSIHQPTSDVFELFSHIILMHAGNVVYQGSCDDAVLFFSKLSLYCPRNCNPSDFYIKLIADDENHKNYSEIIKNNYDQEPHRKCEIYDDDESEFRNTQAQKTKRVTCFWQIFILLLRHFIESKRKLKETLIETGIFMITAVTLSVLYSGVRGFEQTSIQDIQGSFFMLSTEIIFTFSYAAIYEFPAHLPIIRREVGEKTYSLSAYYFALVVSYIPKAFITSYTFLGVIYLSVSYAEDFLTYVKMAFTLSLASTSATAYGVLLSSLFASQEMAAAIASPFDLFLLIFGGLYYNIDSIPYAKYFSMFYYTNEALTYEYWYTVENIDCSEKVNLPCLRNGTEVLSNYAFNTAQDTVIWDYIGLVTVTLVMHIISFLNVVKYVRKVGYY